MPSGGDAVGFIATPGTANIQPRIDGAKPALKASGKNINFTSVASGAELPQENTTINAYVLAHKSTLKGIFAVDAGSTQTVGAIVAKYSLQSKVASGGFDLTPQTLSAIKAGSLGFTIDQQPYLQGFLPVLVPLPVQPVRWPGEPAGDQHRPDLRHQGQCRSLPDHHDPGTRVRAPRRSYITRSGPIA